MKFRYGALISVASVVLVCSAARGPGPSKAKPRWL